MIDYLNKNLIIIGKDGKPITDDHREFLSLIIMAEKELGAGFVLGLKAMMEAVVNKYKK